jgi:virginiamycin B lyase
VATTTIHDASHLLAVAEDSVWIPFDTEGIVQRIDGRTGQVVATIETGVTDMESDGDIVPGGGFIWTINRGAIVTRIDPRANTVNGTFRPPPGTSSGRRHGGGSLWGFRDLRSALLTLV